MEILFNEYETLRITLNDRIKLVAVNYVSSTSMWKLRRIISYVRHTSHVSITSDKKKNKDGPNCLKEF